jgi:hypothetical protein
MHCLCALPETVLAPGHGLQSLLVTLWQNVEFAERGMPSTGCGHVGRGCRSCHRDLRRDMHLQCPANSHHYQHVISVYQFSSGNSRKRLRKGCRVLNELSRALHAPLMGAHHCKKSKSNGLNVLSQCLHGERVGMVHASNGLHSAHTSAPPCAQPHHACTSQAHFDSHVNLSSSTLYPEAFLCALGCVKNAHTCSLRPVVRSGFARA